MLLCSESVYGVAHLSDLCVEAILFFKKKEQKVLFSFLKIPVDDMLHVHKYWSHVRTEHLVVKQCTNR